MIIEQNPTIPSLQVQTASADSPQSMARFLRKKRSPEEKDKIAEAQKPRRLRFKRKKEQKIPCLPNGASIDTSLTSASELSTIVPPFSSLAEMAILHNSVSNSVSEDDKPDSLPAPSTALKTRSVMQFALQSRMFQENAAWDSLCDDLAVEESIECVFEHQLEDGLEMNVEDDDESYMDNGGDEPSSSYRESHYTSGKLVQVGSFSPSHKNDFANAALQHISRPSRSNLVDGRTKCTTFTCNTCRDGEQVYLGIAPDEWPQAPLFLRSTPGSGTNIIGVRYADSKEYLPTQWWNDIPNNVILKHSQYWCSKCCCLPINNGNEALGKVLVIDFESELFQGTLQVRIRKASGTTPGPYNDSIGYFSGLNRHYQSVIQGRFKRDGIPMIRCVAGQSFTGPLNLPPAYIVKGGIRIMNFFAPRLQAKIEGHSPFITSPLGSTPQTIKVDNFNNTTNANFRACSSISEEQEEPDNESRLIVPIKIGNGTTSISRTKARKKAFDRLCADGDDTLTFDTNRVYSFEFLQHLVDFQTFDLSLGNMFGKMDLSQALNGQPIKIMAAYQHPSQGSADRKELDLFDNLWSFDLWNEKAYYEMLKKV